MDLTSFISDNKRTLLIAGAVIAAFMLMKGYKNQGGL